MGAFSSAKLKLQTARKRVPLAVDILRKPTSVLNYHRSYSQEGEDMLLKRLIGDKLDGFYVDIGAHHPTKFSNTAHFYELGWKGINVDASKESIAKLEKARSRDVNIHCGVGKPSSLTFYHYDEPALNTFDEGVVAKRKKDKIPYKIIKKEIIEIRSLGSILGDVLDSNTLIDFLSIDVEGKDQEVLESNDWMLFRPTLVLVECHGFDMTEPYKNSSAMLLNDVGYKIVAKTLSTVVFQNVRPK